MDKKELIGKLQEKKDEGFLTIVIDRNDPKKDLFDQAAKIVDLEVLTPRSEVGAKQKAKFMANRRGWPKDEGIAIEKMYQSVFLVRGYRSESLKNPKILK